jgi:hypothetical protein
MYLWSGPAVTHFDISRFKFLALLMIRSGDLGVETPRSRKTQNPFSEKVVVISGGRVEVKTHAWCISYAGGVFVKDVWIKFMGF